MEQRKIEAIKSDISFWIANNTNRLKDVISTISNLENENSMLPINLQESYNQLSDSDKVDLIRGVIGHYYKDE